MRRCQGPRHVFDERYDSEVLAGQSKLTVSLLSVFKMPRSDLMQDVYIRIFATQLRYNSRHKTIQLTSPLATSKHQDLPRFALRDRSLR